MNVDKLEALSLVREYVVLKHFELGKRQENEDVKLLMKECRNVISFLDVEIEEEEEKKGDLESKHICNSCIWQKENCVASCNDSYVRVIHYPQVYCKSFEPK